MLEMLVSLAEMILGSNHWSYPRMPQTCFGVIQSDESELCQTGAYVSAPVYPLLPLLPLTEVSVLLPLGSPHSLRCQFSGSHQSDRPLQTSALCWQLVWCMLPLAAVTAGTECGFGQQLGLAHTCEARQKSIHCNRRV